MSMGDAVAADQVTAAARGGPSMLPLAAAAAALAHGRMTVSDLMTACRRPIDRFNPSFRAFSHLAPVSDAELAGLQAELGSAPPRSPLHGIAVSMKGNIPVRGLPWTEGSAVFAARVAADDAAIVRRARDAGAVIVGATTLSELAMYGVRNAFEPMGLNPWCPERTAGGSSTGAGVAACLGMAYVNIGTDSGGSIRNPACHQGVVGFMPSPLALSPNGVPDHVPSFPALGLICRSVECAALAFRALRQQAAPRRDPSRRLLVPTRLVEAMCDSDTAALFAEALRRIEAGGIALVPCDLESWRAAEAAAGVISLHESARSLDRMDLRAAGPGIVKRRAAGARVAAHELDAARRSADEFAAEVASALARAQADAFVTPTWPFAAPPIDAETVDVRDAQVPLDAHRNCFVRAANAARAAAITVPMGVYRKEMVPAGLHLMASAGADETLLAIAGEIERLSPPLPLPPPLRG